MMQNGNIRRLWSDYQLEVLFGSVLLVLTGLSYWLGTFIPDWLFENYINPVELIATVAVCFFGAFLLLSHKEQSVIRRSWAGVLLVWGCVDVLTLGLRYLLGIKAIGGMPSDPLYNASVTLGNLLAFMLFVYPTQVLRPGWLNWKRAVLLLLPMIVLGVVDYFVPANLLHFIMIYPVIIFFLVCRHIRKYRQWCEDNFSSMEDIDTQWIVRYLIMLFIVGLSFYFIVFWYVPNRMFTQQWMFLLMFAYTTESVLFRPDPWEKVQKETVQDTNDIAGDDVHCIKDEEMNPVSETYRATLEAWLEKEKPYLNPDFQLMDLRQVLPLNRSYLSQFINKEYGCTFYQWVNGLRIEQAKRLLTEQPELKIQDVAKRCGFSSRQVFSRTFLRETGQIPSEWISTQNNAI